MNDLDAALRATYQARSQTPEPPSLLDDIMAIPDEGIPQEQRWLTLPSGAFRSLFSATRLVVAGAVVALFGGVLLAAVLTGPNDAPGPAAVTDSPEPLSTADLLPGVDLVTEEIQPGVYRVLSDGTRQLDDVDDVVVTPGGDVFVARNPVDPQSPDPDSPMHDSQVIRLGEPDPLLEAREGTEWSLDLSEDGSPIVDNIGPLAGLGETGLKLEDLERLGEVDLPEGMITGPEGGASVFRDGGWSPYPDVLPAWPSATEGPCAGWSGPPSERLVVGDECWLDDAWGLQITKLDPSWRDPDVERDDASEVVPATVVGAAQGQALWPLHSLADGTGWVAVSERSATGQPVFQGLAHYDGSTWSFIPYDTPTGVPSFLDVAPDGSPWVGLTTDVVGLGATSQELSVTSWDGEQWRTYGPVRVTLGRDVRQTHFRPDGSVLFLDGRVALDGSELRTTGLERGELVFDERGNAWKVSGNDLFVITRDAFTALASGEGEVP